VAELEAAWRSCQFELASFVMRLWKKLSACELAKVSVSVRPDIGVPHGIFGFGIAVQDGAEDSI
jgi:hypothetical protein